jgi:hypothetical protein
MKENVFYNLTQNNKEANDRMNLNSGSADLVQEELQLSLHFGAADDLIVKVLQLSGSVIVAPAK